MTRADDLEPGRPEAGRRLLDLRIQIFDDRLQRPHDERQPDEDQRDRHAEPREGDLDPVGLDERAEHARSAHTARSA